MHLQLSASVLAAVLIAPGVPAQTVGGAWAERGTYVENLPAGASFGYAMDGRADVDGDQVADLVVGAPGDAPSGMPGAGSVFVYSGASGQLLHHFPGPHAYASFGRAVAAADLDLDGHADIVVGSLEQPGSPNPGAARVYSGRTGLLLYAVGPTAAEPYAGALAVVADRDLDGVQELLIGTGDAPVGGNPFTGTVELRSGATGALLHRWVGPNFQDNFGASVTELDDLTGDGVGEFAFGIPGYDLINREGAIQIADGASYAVLRTFTVTWHGPFQQLGACVANPGDVNGDGVGDLLAGATASGLNYTGRAYVFDGASGFQYALHDIPGRAGVDFFGESLAPAGDVDQDGCDDFLVGASSGLSGAAGYVELYSGRDGSPMRDWTGAAGDRLGRVQLAADLNDDGDPEILLAPGTSNAGPGFVRVVGLDGFLRVGARAWPAGTSASIPLQLDFPASEAGMRFVLLASLDGVGPTTVAGLQVPLSPDSLFQRMLAGWTPPLLVAARGTLDAAGDGQSALVSTQLPSAAIGRTIYLAAATYDPLTSLGRLSSVSRSIVVVP